MLTDTKKSPNAKWQSLPFADVAWTGGLLAERFETCANSTVPHLQRMFESAGISHVLENFRIAAGEAEGEFDGTVFGDGDFYKWMESAACAAVRTGNQALLDRLEEYAALIAKAQQPDGYLSTKQIIGERSGKASRMGDINDFEVYNFGHLFTAACLYKRLTGRDSLLCVAERAADYLGRLYRRARETGDVQTAVCPSHYMGLAELYRTTGNGRYLSLLREAVELRDSVKEGLDDNQDRLPLREHTAIIGHAVRANYLYAGVADLCLEEDDPELVSVLHRVWESLVTQKLYLTGGCGALYNGASPYGNFFHHQLVHQAYGYEYQLPNVTAYNETCASIGGVYWAWRMLCLEGKAGYADILERMALNVNLAAVSLDGKRFFYENMLRRAKKLPYELVWGQERAEYILSYCCPPNLARFITQMSEYAYGVDETGLYTVLYGANRARVTLPGRPGSFACIQETGYPYDGKIVFRFEPGEGVFQPFMLYLRVPAWSSGGSVLVERNGAAERIALPAGSAYVPVSVLSPDAVVTLDLNMEARLTCAHPLVEEDAGQVAVEYGPLVYCMEGMDAPGGTLDDLSIPSDVSFAREPFAVAGREVVSLRGRFLRRRHPAGEPSGALYRTYADLGFDEEEVRLIPYFAWDNRGLDEMRIWFPVVPRR